MSLTPRERERLDALVGAYKRLPKAEPSPELDAAVLANARAAVAKPAAKGGRPRWPGLLATAATLTVAVGLAWQLRTADRRVESEVPQAVVPAPQPAPAPADDGALRDAAPGYVPAPAAAPEQSAAEVPRTISTPAPEPARVPLARRAQPPVDDAGLAKKSSQAGEEAQSRPTAGAGPARDAAGDADARKRAAEPFPAELETKQAPAPEPPVVFDEPLPMAEEAPPPAATPPEPESVLLQEAKPADVRENEAPREAVPAAPPAPPAPATAARPAPPAKAATEQPADASTRGQEIERTGVTGSRTRREDRAAQAPAVAGTLGAAAAVREPRAWLDDIERLLREGRREQAIAELERFRAAYPDHELPRALRDLKP